MCPRSRVCGNPERLHYGRSRIDWEDDMEAGGDISQANLAQKMATICGILLDSPEFEEEKREAVRFFTGVSQSASKSALKRHGETENEHKDSMPVLRTAI